MRAKTFKGWALGCFIMAASGLSAFAAPLTINFKYVVGTAQAVGTVTFESTLIANPGNNDFTLPNPAVLGISMTVTGAAAGNGTYTTADFTDVRFETNGARLNLSGQLVGQPTPGDPFGTPSGNGGDLNFFSAGPAPNGNFFFTLGANGGAADDMLLVSAVASAPVPTLGEWMIAALALLLVGVGIMQVRRTRT